MKIISVRFRNVNSLKDEHYIDFSAPPFYGSGLFSITGATGAGKTTILDAITLALYGRTPRQKAGEQITEIVTRFTTSAFSEVVFESGGDHYRARWSVRRARSKVEGAFQPVQMELAYAASGELIESKTSDARARIAQLINLDYDQFLRSVLLAQGDFTRFLKADDKEKSALLEKVTHTAIYSRISAFVYDKTERVEKKKLEELHRKLEGVVLLGEEELVETQQRFDQLMIQEAEKMKMRNRLVRERQWLERIAALRLEIAHWQEQEKQFRITFDAQQEELRLLRRHRQALPLQGKRTELQLRRHQLDNYRKEMADIERSIPQKTGLCSALLEQKTTAATLLDNLQKERIRLDEVITRILPLDTRMGHVNTEYDRVCRQEQALQESLDRETERLSDGKLQQDQDKRLLDDTTGWVAQHQPDGEIAAFLPGYKSMTAQVLEAKKMIARIDSLLAGEQKKVLATQEELVVITRKLTEQGAAGKAKEEALEAKRESLAILLDGKDLASLRTQIAALQEQAFLCDKQYELATRVTASRKQAADMTSGLAAKQELLKHNKKVSADLQQRLASDIQLLEAYQEIVNKDRLIAGYESARRQLSKEAPCPLCGATEHPYVTEYHTFHFDEHGGKLQHQKAIVEARRREVTVSETELARLSTSIETQYQALEAIKQEMEADVQRFQRNNQQLPVALGMEDLSLLQRLAAGKQQESLIIQELIVKAERTGEEIRNLQQALQEIRITEKELAGRKETCATILATARERIAQAEAERQEWQIHFGKLEEKIKQALTPLRMAYSPDTHVETQAELQQRSDVFIRKQQDVVSLQRKIELLEQELVHTENSQQSVMNELNQVRSEQEKLKVALAQLQEERRDLFGDKTPDEEQRRIREQVAEATGKLEELRIDLDQAQAALSQSKKELAVLGDKCAALERETDTLADTLTGLSHRAGFDTLEELASAYLPDDVVAGLEAAERDLDRRGTEIRQSLTQTQKALEEEGAKQLSQQTTEELEVLIAEVDVSLREMNQQAGSIRTLLEQNQAAVQRFRDIKEALATQEQVYHRWRRLNDMIGSADGDKFKRFAQGVTLARLVQLANIRLAAFSKRYRLLKQPGNGLELEISDTWQAGAVRPVSTLSGGESFLVSLALALGLSDLASNRIQIDSLFIDEGFGTLDSETLEVAIDALENLRADGKLIGIISHIDALKERIGAQVHVEKLSGGVSMLQVMECGVVVAG